jgi:hypothetical protein
MAYITLLNNFCKLILNLIDVRSYLNRRSTMTVSRISGRHLSFHFRTHYLATYGKQPSFSLYRNDKCEIIGLVQVIREHFAALTHPFLFQLQVKLLVNEARTVAFLLILQIFVVLRDAPRMDSIEQVDEDLSCICFLIQNELVHEVKPLKQSFPQVVSVISWGWVRP